MPCWARETKEKKINKRDYIKLGSLCREGNHQQNVKTTYRKGEGICKWYTWERLIFKILLKTHITPKKYKPTWKWAEDPNRHFSKEDMLMTNKQGRWLTSLIIREMPIKTTKNYDLTPVRMAVINKSTNSKCWQGCGRKGTLVVQPLWKRV